MTDLSLYIKEVKDIEYKRNPSENAVKISKIFNPLGECLAAEYWDNSGRGGVWKSGFSPKCGNKKRNICRIGKAPTAPCKDCNKKNYLKVNPDLIQMNILGGPRLGIYPMVGTDTTGWIAGDLDNHDGKRNPVTDLRKIQDVCTALDIPIFIFSSNSGEGYHFYLFFENPVKAFKARALMYAVIDRAGIDISHKKNKDGSFDCFFPKQDKLRAGEIGNLIALPWNGESFLCWGTTGFLNPTTLKPYGDVIEERVEVDTDEFCTTEYTLIDENIEYFLDEFKAVSESDLDALLKEMVVDVKEPAEPSEKQETMSRVDLNPDSIPIGERDDTIFRICSSYRGKGMSEEEITAIITTLHYPKIEQEPGNEFTLEDCRNKIKSACKYPQGSNDTAEPVKICTDYSKYGENNLTLNIPEKLYKDKGLITSGINALVAAGAPNIIQYNMPVVLSVIARAIASKICCCRKYPNFFNVKIGRSSNGKTDSSKIFLESGLSGMQGFFGATSIASGPGLMQAVKKNPQTLITLDEISHLFKSTGKKDGLANGIRSALLELYEGGRIQKEYGNEKDSYIIENAVLSILGNATPMIFDDIAVEDLETGLMQRFEFWCFGGETPHRVRYSSFTDMENFISRISEIFRSSPPTEQHDLSGIIGNFDVKMNADADDIRWDYSKRITDESNNPDLSPGEPGFISRKYNLSIKYALVHMAATRDVKDLYAPMGSQDIKWGIDIAEMLCGWKLKNLASKVTAGDFHKYCELFKDGIIASKKAGRKATKGFIKGRRSTLKALTPRQIDEVITSLTQDGYICERNGEYLLTE